jgi:asparagine synthase (glutamine-hydrolysing)
MKNEDGSLVVTFNGEIYNYRELRKGLEEKGYRFYSNSDTEVLLHLYAAKGAEMVHDLRGMYAFAIWDDRKKGLFLARDPFGIKPLYYADDGNTFRAASQVKALLAGGSVDTSPQPAGHVGFFLWGNVPEPFTLYRGIKSLPAGTALWVDQGGGKTFTSFCSIHEELVKSSSNPYSISQSEMRLQLREALLDSVRQHLVADVPVGVFLSSGLDSTTLVALSSELVSDQLHTVTLGFREYLGTCNDEVPLAELVASKYGTKHSTICVEKQDFHADLELLLDAMDQPSIDGVNSYFVSKAAVAANLKVAISGLGGDELFGSYPSFKQIPQLVKNVLPFACIPGLGKGFRFVSAPLLKHLTSHKYAGVLEYGGSYSGAYLLRRGMFMPWELCGLLDDEIVKEGWRELKTLHWLEQNIEGISSSHLKISALEMEWYMRNQLLRDTDWASMAHSLEIRVPLVDLDVLRTVLPMFCAAVPPGKQDMALTPENPLPEEVLNRGKSGFSVPVRDWLLDKEPCYALRSVRGWATKVYGELTK